MAELEQVSVKEFLKKDFSVISEEAKLSTALGRFEKRVETLFVFDENGNFKGAVDETHILKSKPDPSNTKVKSVLYHCPRVFENEGILRAARLMIENDAKELPVFNQGNHIIGTVSTEAILKEASRTSFGKTKILDVCTRNPEIATQETTIGEAFNIMREKNISHLPLIERKKNKTFPIGMVAMHDIATKYFVPKEKAGLGEVISEKVHLMKLPAANIANYPLETVFEKETIRKAVEKMLERNTSALAVLNTAGEITGIATKTDIIQALLLEEKEKQAIIFSFAKGHEIESIDEIDLAHIKNDFEKFGKKYAHSLKESHVLVYIKKHREKTRHLSLYNVRVRVFSPVGVIAAHANGYGLEFAVHNALEKLTKLTEKIRGKTKARDEKARSGRGRKRKWF